MIIADNTVYVDQEPVFYYNTQDDYYITTNTDMPSEMNGYLSIWTSTKTRTLYSNFYVGEELISVEFPVEIIMENAVFDDGFSEDVTGLGIKQSCFLVPVLVNSYQDDGRTIQEYSIDFKVEFYCGVTIIATAKLQFVIE
ncbi:MAG: hypothetical protein R3Y49_07480 [Rikenellaceae bacterium]